MEGEYHEPGCDMERCPFCGNQLITCDCCYRFLGFDFDPFHPTCNLPIEIYKNGLTDELSEKWEEILNQKGKIPYINYPLICARCGLLWPELFMISNDEWERYIEPHMRQSIICRPCFDWIKVVTDEALRKDIGNE